MAHSIQDFLELRATLALGFSSEGATVLVASNLTGTNQLYGVPAGGGPPIQVTDFEEPCSGRYLPTTNSILVQMDTGGNERLQIYLVEEDGSDFRPVVHEPDYIHRLGGVQRDGSAIAYASNRRNGVDFDIYVRDLASGDDRRVFEPGGMCSAAGFSPDGQWLAVVRATERNMDSDLYLVGLVSGEVVHVSPHEEEAEFGSPAWLADGSGFYFATDCGREFKGIAKYEMATRTWSYVMETAWDAACWTDWSGSRLLVATNEDGCTRMELFSPRTLEPLGEVRMPGKGVAWYPGFVPDPVLSPDGRYVAFSFLSATEPGDVWLHDTKSGELCRLTASARAVPASDCVEPELHRFQSFDGETVPVFLYRPKGSGETRPAVVAFVHGGPESQYQPVWNPVIQYLVHRGYAVAAPNVRGSTGYGKRYHHLDDVYRRLDSVRDLAGLHAWLPTVGLDADRCALWGGSYGGYMVLAGLTFQPELWAAGVDIVGISSLVTFLENTSKWRRVFREREYGSLERDRAFLEEVSPLTHIANLRAPLFIIHGKNDPRVPLAEAEQMHRVLAEREIPCELVVYADEGHGLMKLKNRLDAYPRAVDFLDGVLGAGVVPG